jgi:hypothetical protein
LNGKIVKGHFKVPSTFQYVNKYLWTEQNLPLDPGNNLTLSGVAEGPIDLSRDGSF